MLAWPWRRFERFYEAFQKRHLVEMLERRKEQMIAALWANSNFDDEKGTRQNAIEEIEANYQQVVEQILFDELEQEEEEIDKSNPFFAAADRGLAKIEAPRMDEGTTVKDVVGNEYSVDQA